MVTFMYGRNSCFMFWTAGYRGFTLAGDTDDPVDTTQRGERIENAHSFSILHIEGIAGELARTGITQNEMKSGEGYSK